MGSSFSKTTYLLTGDIGGTNSRMSLYDVASGKPLVYESYKNADHLPEEVRNDDKAFVNRIIVPFLTHCWKVCPTLVNIEACQIVACLATAGWVNNNQVLVTNLDGLPIDGTAIARDESNEFLKAVKYCKLINDFVAQGYGCLTLQPSEVTLLHGPENTANLKNLPVGPKVCVGPGTGLGECYLTPIDDEDKDTMYSCFPSEGGHVEYAPRHSFVDEIKMCQFLVERFDATNQRTSVERVASGEGLANVYEFLAEKYPSRIDSNVHQRFLQAKKENKDAAAVVSDNAQPGTLCLEAINIMMSAYGCEVGSAAIKWIPLGGLFLTGNITAKNMKHIQGRNSEFMKSYLHKGRVSYILEYIPLFAVKVTDLGLRGVHKAALMEYERFSNGKVRSSKRENSHKVSLATAVAAGFFVGVVVMNRMRR